MRLSSQVTLRLSSVHLSFPLLFTRLPPPSLPSICLLQPQARFLYLCAPLVVPAAIYLFVQHCYLHSLPCTLSTMQQTHPAPWPPTRLNHNTVHYTLLEQMSSARYRSKSASAGDPRLEQTRLLFGSESELLVAARRCLYRVGMQHATLSSTHIQRDEHMESGASEWKFHKQSTSTR